MAAHHATRSATTALRADRAMVADQVLDPDEDTEHARCAEHEIIAMAPSSTSHSPREVNKRSPSVGRRTGSMPRRSSFRTPEVTDDDSYTRRRVSTAPARPTKSMQQSAQARAPLSEERKSLLCDNLERMTQIERELRDEKQAIARELELHGELHGEPHGDDDTHSESVHQERGEDEESDEGDEYDEHGEARQALLDTLGLTPKMRSAMAALLAAPSQAQSIASIDKGPTKAAETSSKRYLEGIKSQITDAEVKRFGFEPTRKNITSKYVDYINYAASKHELIEEWRQLRTKPVLEAMATIAMRAGLREADGYTPRSCSLSPARATRDNYLPTRSAASPRRTRSMHARASRSHVASTPSAPPSP